MEAAATYNNENENQAMLLLPSHKNAETLIHFDQKRIKITKYQIVGG